LLVLLGGTPVGAPLVGLVSDAFGARSGPILGGLVSASCALALPTLIARRVRRLPPLTTPVSVTGSALTPAGPAGDRRQPPWSGLGSGR
jgi:hypothetical protein